MVYKHGKVVREIVMYPAIARANFRNSIQVQSDRSVERIDGFLLNGTAPCEGTESIESYALSPDGKIGACVSMFGDAGPLTIFSLHPLKALKSVFKVPIFCQWLSFCNVPRLEPYSCTG
jgi:hypothetical protein